MSVTTMVVGHFALILTAMSFYMIGYALKEDRWAPAVAGSVMFGISVFVVIRLFVIPNGLLVP